MRLVAALLFGFLLCAGLEAQTKAQTYTGYSISTFAGGGTPDGEVATSANLTGVSSVAVDNAGNVYFEDGQIVLRLNRNGILTHIAGNGTIGTAGDGGPATQAQLGYQGALAVDADGNVFVSDWLNDRVRKISNGVISTVAGGGGFEGDNQPATSVQLSGPQGIAVDGQGNLYIAEAGSGTIRKVSDGTITTVAGMGTIGFAGDGGPAINAQFAALGALAVDRSSNLYVADYGNNRVRKITNGIISTVAGTGTIGYFGPNGDGGPATSADLNMFVLSGLSTDAAGDLYISSNDSIRKVVNENISTVVNGYAGGGPLGLPAGLAVDYQGMIYVASLVSEFDGDCINRISQGTIAAVAGGGLSIGDPAAALSAQFNIPVGLALDSSGNLYIADSNNNRIRRVSNGTITTVAGTGYTFPDTSDGGPALQADLIQPEGVVIDSSGVLWIGDNSWVIQKVTNGTIMAVVGQDSQKDLLDNDENFIVSKDGTIYTADLAHSAIHKISNGVITTFAGTGTAGYSGDNGPATSAQLAVPYGLALDSENNLYIADSENGVIRKVANGIITTFASGLTQPTFLAFDSKGALYVADVFQVKKISGGIVTTIAGGGPSYGDGGPATLAQLNPPGGIAVDGQGRVYVADMNNNRIRLLTPDQLSCTYQVDQSAFIGANAGGSFTFSLQTPADCPWSTANVPAWITSPAQGGGNSTIIVNYQPNPGAARAATFSIAGISISIGQYGAGPATLQLASAASYSIGPLAAGSIATLFASNLTAETATASTLPLPTILAGVTITLTDASGMSQTAPLFYVSPTQVNFQVPDDAALGSGVLTVSIGSGQTLSGPVTVSSVSPALFTLNGAALAAATAIHVSVDGTQTIQPVFQVADGAIVPKPIDLGPATDHVYLALYGTGVRNAGTAGVSALVGGISEPAVWAGAQGSFPGEDQINIELPRSLARAGNVFLNITASGQNSNSVMVIVQ